MSDDLIVRNATLPDGRTGQDIAIRAGRIAAIGPALDGGRATGAGRRRPSRLAAFRRCAFPHGRDALARPAAPQRVRHAARRHRAVGRAEAPLDARGGGRACLALLRPRGRAGTARHPLPCRHLRRPAPRRGCAPRGEAARGAVSRPPAGRVPAGRLLPLARRGREPHAGARSRRRGGRRHPAFRAHDGGRRGVGARLVRDRRRARPARRPALRRDRRSAVPAHRDARLGDAAARASGPRRRLAPHLHAFHGQLLRLQAPAPHGGGGGGRHRQSPHQHRHPGPARHLSEAARHDPHPRDAGARDPVRLRARLRHGSLGTRSAPATCWRWPAWRCTWRT